MSKWVDVADRVRTVGLAGLAEFLKADRFVNFADLVEVETLKGKMDEFVVEREAYLAENAVPGRLGWLGWSTTGVLRLR